MVDELAKRDPVVEERVTRDPAGRLDLTDHAAVCKVVDEAVCFRASDRARFVTGQKPDVDGGYTT